MIKLTNYENSLALKRAGIEPKTGDWKFFSWKKNRGEKPEIILQRPEISQWLENHCLAWDFESLLALLPKEIEGVYLGECFLSFNSTKHKTSIGYGNENEYIEDLYCNLEEGSNLADCVAILLLQLADKKLINLEGND